MDMKGARLLFEYGVILNQMDELYAAKREKEQQIKRYVTEVREICGRTGKTIEELEGDT